MENIYHGVNPKFANLLGTNNKCQGPKKFFCFIRDSSQNKNLLGSKCKIKYLLGIKNIFKPFRKML